MNIADYLVKKLEELGINDFFGLPGDYNFNILYAIENNPNTNWIGCTNELNAGYAADGYARQRGYGAIVTTYGVGELSAINAIAGSFAENVPVITIVGVPATKSLEEKKLLHHSFLEINSHRYEEIHKSVVATTAFLNRDNARLEIDRVLRVFVKERRPVYIAIPMDIVTLETTVRDTDYNWVSEPEALEEVIAKINEKIKASRKPVILADVLVKRFDATIELKEFVEKSGIPATNFLMGTNLINSDCKNYLGTYYADYENPLAKKYVDETDCLISIGVVYSDVNSFGFKLPFDINSQIAIFGTYTFIDGTKYDNVKMVDVLEGLTKVVESHNFEIEKPIIGYENSKTDGTTLNSDYIYPRLQEFLKENDILICDTGVSTFGACQMLFPNNVDVHFQALWGSIGWATPAALGASIACPNRRVVLLTGEGAHQLTALEIGTMLRNGVKPVVIVLNNSGYTIERALSNNPDDNFNNIMQMNYSKFARVFEGDIWSTKVETAEDFDKALRVTQIMNKLCYIEVCADKMDMPKLAVDFLSKIGSNSAKKVEKREKETKLELTRSDDMKFETTVHESLKE